MYGDDVFIGVTRVCGCVPRKSAPFAVGQRTTDRGGPCPDIPTAIRGRKGNADGDGSLALIYYCFFSWWWCTTLRCPCGCFCCFHRCVRCADDADEFVNTDSNLDATKDGVSRGFCVVFVPFFCLMFPPSFCTWYRSLYPCFFRPYCHRSSHYAATAVGMGAARTRLRT